MGRTICVWLIACLALASANPVPGPTSSQDLMNMILNAKPEDNAIDFQSPEDLQLLEGQEPSKPESNEQQDLVLDVIGVPALSEEPQDVIPDVQQAQEVPEENQEAPEPETPQEAPEENQEAPEPETPQEVPEENQEVPEPEMPQEVPEESQEAPESEMPQVSPDTLPVVEEDQLETGPYTPEEPEQIEPEEQVFVMPEEQILPFPEEPPVLMEPEEEQVFSGPEYQVFPINEAEILIPENEQLYSETEEEIIPVFEEEEDPVEPYEVQIVPIQEEISEPYEGQVVPILEENSEFHPELEESMTYIENEEQMPFEDEPEDFPDIIVMGEEDDEPSQFVSEEPVIPGFVDPPVDMQESIFGSFAPTYFEEGPQEDIHEDSQGPVYFDTYAYYEQRPDETFEIQDDQVEEVEQERLVIPPSSGMSDEEETPFVQEEQTEELEQKRISVSDFLSPGEWVFSEVIPEEIPSDVEDTPFMQEEQYSTPEDTSIIDGTEVFDEQTDQFGEPQQKVIIGDILDAVLRDTLNGNINIDGMVMIKPMVDEEFPSQLDEGQVTFISDDIPRPADFEPTIVQDYPENPNGFLSVGLPMPGGFIETNPVNPEEASDEIETAEEHFISNEQLPPIAEYPEEEITPIIAERETYWIPDTIDQNPITFPKDTFPLRNLPVFPSQWREENFFQPPSTDEHSHDLFHHEPEPFLNPDQSQGPSYGPPMREQSQPMFDMPADDMPSSEDTDMLDDDIIFTIKDEDLNIREISGPINLPNDFYHYPGSQKFPNSDQPLLSSFPRDFHGPNTFPLNFRISDTTPNFMNGNFNPYNLRNVPQNVNQKSIYPDSPVAPQTFNQEPNSPDIFNTMSNAPNSFYPMLNEPVEMFENPSNEDLNMNLKVFRPSSSMSMSNDRLSQQQQQQFDVQVSYIPYENTFNFRPYSHHTRPYFRYPNEHPSNNFNNNNFNIFRKSPYSEFNPYMESNPYPDSGLYPSPSMQNRYSVGNRFRNYYDYGLPYNYPTPIW